MAPLGTVPIVDLSLGEAHVAQVVRAACEGSGFMYVAGHGVAQSDIDAFFDQMRQLFSLPLDTKKAMIADENNRGWTPFQEETLDPAHQTQGDTKEGFYFGREVPKDSPEASKPLHGPNQWPPAELLPKFREVTTTYFDALHALGMRLLRLLSLSLGLPAEYFDSSFDQPMIFLRPLHYAAEVSKPDDGIFGAGAHTDYGMLTILATDDVPGLQIHREGRWQDVAPVQGAFIVNLGDMLERWTNGLYRSTLHRVVNTTGRERYSVAFFFEPNFDARVECLPQCCGPDRPPRYPPTTAGQHLMDKYAQTHAGYTVPAEFSRP